jgi:mono/diheme cytochrome c family protein
MTFRRFGPRQAMAAGVALLVTAMYGVMTGSARATQPDIGTEAQRESGRQLYAKYCAQCHGDNGDGEGVAAPHLRPRPRDFTQGKYKVRSTPTGACPRMRTSSTSSGAACPTRRCPAGRSSPTSR